MKIIITESQYKMLLEEQKVLHIPSMKIFDNNWNLLQKFLERKGYPLYTIGGDLNLYGSKIKSLGNLQSVGGNLDLYGTKIKSLGSLQSVGGNLKLYDSNIESLGNLQSVGGYFYLEGTKIQSLGNLQSVGGDLNLRDAPISERYSEEEIRQMVQVDGYIYI